MGRAVEDPQSNLEDNSLQRASPLPTAAMLTIPSTHVLWVCPGPVCLMWRMRRHQLSSPHWGGTNSSMKRKARMPRLEKANFYLVFRTSETSAQVPKGSGGVL